MKCGHFCLAAVVILVLWSTTRAQHPPPAAGGYPPMPSGPGGMPGGHGPMPGGHGPMPGGHGPMPGGHGPMPGGHGAMPGGHGAMPGGHGPMPGGPGPSPGGPAPVAAGPGPMPMSSGPPPPPPNQYPHVRSSHCLYLTNAPSLWGKNASPFKLKTQSYARKVKRGYPVEVTILPFFSNFKYFSFTDYAIWAEPTYLAQGGAAAPAAATSHLGVWQVFPQYSGGSGSMKCNEMSKGDDTVGSFEERMLDLLKTLFPNDARLQNFKPSARHAVAFLWYPDETTMRSGATIKFRANVKAFGQWFTMESNPWTVEQPPRPRRIHRPRPAPRQPMKRPAPMEWGSMIEQISNMNQNARTMARELEQAQNGQL